MMDATQFKARKLCRLLEDALVAALGSEVQERRDHAADTLGRVEVLLGEVELLGMGGKKP